MAEESYRAVGSRRIGRRRLLQATGAGAAALAGAGVLACGGAPKQSTFSSPSGTQAAGAGRPHPGGTYQGYVSTNPTLDPFALSQVATDFLAGAVLSRLFRFKTSTNPLTITNHDTEPDLAQSAESPDAVTWTFKLRPNATFHNIAPVNGHAVEAEDIKASFQRALSMPQNPNRGALAMVNPDQIQTPDKQTVVFKLNYAYAPFTKTVASPIYAWMFPREALAGSYDPAKTMIGSGPFMLQSATPDVSFVLKKNPDWFESGRPYLDGVNLAVVPASAQQMAQFTTAHLDEVSVGGNDLDTMKQQNPKATVLTNQPSASDTVYVQLGDSSSVFLDPRVRQALSMSIDREAMIKAIFNGKAEITLFVPPNLGKWSLQLKDVDATTQGYYTYNLAEAKKLLQAAGVTDQTFKFAYAASGGGTSANPWYPKQAEALRNFFGAAGLKLEPYPIDWVRDYLDSGKGFRQGFYPKDTLDFSGEQPFTEVDEVLYSGFDSKSTQNEEHVNDPQVDGMIARARTIVNEDDRLKAYLDIQKYIANKVYPIVTQGNFTYTIVQPRVQNFQPGSQQGEIVETYSKLWLAQ